MIYAVLSGFLIVFVLPVIYPILKKVTGYFLTLLPFSLFIFFTHLWLRLPVGEAYHETYPWNESFGLHLAFLGDGLSLFMAMLITGIGTLIFIYASYYMKEYKHYLRFFTFITIFMASMLGVVLSDNLLMLVVFWELTSVSSYMLIGFSHEKIENRESALQGLLVTALGGLAMLAGFILINIAAGTNSISELMGMGDILRAHSLYPAIIILVLLGAFTKSAQFPFHFWLPNAMAAPTPVSAFLHSATMVKAGIFLIARFTPVLGGTLEWQLIITIAGAITMFTGAFLAMREVDIKKILAYSTISALGLLTLMLGLGTELAVKACMTYLLAHALYKAALFMIAGIIDKQTGTRDIRELSGKIYKYMPITMIIAVLAGLSLAGIPPFIGFISKELVYEAIIYGPQANLLLIIALILTSIFLFVVMMVVSFRLFFFGVYLGDKDISEAKFGLYIAPLIPAMLGFVLGIFPGLAEPLVGGAVFGTLQAPVEVNLYLWHGFNIVLLLSGLSIVIGIGFYRFWSVIQKFLDSLEIIARYGPENLYFQMLVWLKKLAPGSHNAIQSGKLRNYVMITFLTLLLLAGYSYLRFDPFVFNLNVEFYAFEMVMAITMILALISTILIRQQMGAVITMAVIGIILSIIFLIFGAPDLAITLFLIDTFVIVLFALVINKLPEFFFFRETRIITQNAVLALGVGTLITLIMLSIMGMPVETTLKDYYSEASYPEALGRNIVNVILVDFRSIDTFGEIVVLAIAALGVFTLYKLERK